MPSKKKLSSQQAHCSIGSSDDPLNITFLPAAISPAMLKQVMGGVTKKKMTPQDASDSLDSLVNMVLDAVVEWNLTETDEPDSPIVPLTFDEVAHVGIVLLREILDAMTSTVTVGEASGATS